MVPIPPEPAWIGIFCLLFNLTVSTSTCQAVRPSGRQATKVSGFSAIESSVMQIRPLPAVAIDKECLHDDLALWIVKLE